MVMQSSFETSHYYRLNPSFSSRFKWFCQENHLKRDEKGGYHPLRHYRHLVISVRETPTCWGKILSLICKPTDHHQPTLPTLQPPPPTTTTTNHYHQPLYHHHHHHKRFGPWTMNQRPEDRTNASKPTPSRYPCCLPSHVSHTGFRITYGTPSSSNAVETYVGVYHVGVAKALMENELMPWVLGGSSAGSIVTSIVAARTDEGFCFDPNLFYNCTADFFSLRGPILQHPGWCHRLNNTYRIGAFVESTQQQMRGSHYRLAQQRMSWLLPAMECLDNQSLTITTAEQHSLFRFAKNTC